MRQVSALGDIVLSVDKVDHQPLAGSVSGVGEGRVAVWVDGRGWGVCAGNGMAGIGEL